MTSVAILDFNMKVCSFYEFHRSHINFSSQADEILLSVFQVKDQPKVTFPHEAGCLYTVIMTDPDAPKDKAEVHHWMTINVKDGDSETGAVHSEYFGSGPPQGTGNHKSCLLSNFLISIGLQGQYALEVILPMTKF